MEIYTAFLITIISFFFFFHLLNKFKSKTKNLPPGPPKLPFLGNLLQVNGKVPHRDLRELAKKHGPIMYLKLGEVPLVVISSSGTAKQALKTYDIELADRPSLLLGRVLFNDATDIVTAPYGDYWRQMRKLCTLELLSSKKVKSFRSIREDESRRLVESIRNANGSLVNVSEMVSEMANVVVCRAATGNKYEAELVRIAEEITYWGSGFMLPDLFPSLKFLSTLTGMKTATQKLKDAIDQTYGKMIEEHKQKLANKKERNTVDAEEEDIIDVLLRINETQQLQHPMTSKDIQAVIMDMFTAGTDPTSAVLEWTITELVRNPRVMKKLQTEIREVLKGKETITEADIQELSYLKVVIKEALRLHPPLPLSLPRECRIECKIDGYTIPVKSKVIVNIWAIGKDPQYWVDAESFIPERFENTSIDYMGHNYGYIPFGSGRRICPGMTFGMAAVELPLTQMLYYFDWKLPNNMKPEDIDVTEAVGSTTKKRDNLFLIPTPVYTQK